MAVRSAALPFTLSRSSDVIRGSQVTSTRERLHGLLRLEADRVVIQWRKSSTTERVGEEIRTDHEMGEVREHVVPLSGLAGARVRKASWLSWPPGTYLHLMAADLTAFDEVAGPDEFRLKHPAELVVRVAADARVVAEEFAAELQLALAERACESDLRLQGDVSRGDLTPRTGASRSVLPAEERTGPELPRGSSGTPHER